ncbi:hypothetical protein K443DRAFT_677291, partial [Laccaria amethystina LaAM-08-1]
MRGFASSLALVNVLLLFVNIAIGAPYPSDLSYVVAPDGTVTKEAVAALSANANAKQGGFKIFIQRDQIFCLEGDDNCSGSEGT